MTSPEFPPDFIRSGNLVFCVLTVRMVLRRRFPAADRTECSVLSKIGQSTDGKGDSKNPDSGMQPPAGQAAPVQIRQNVTERVRITAEHPNRLSFQDCIGLLSGTTEGSAHFNQFQFFWKPAAVRHDPLKQILTDGIVLENV